MRHYAGLLVLTVTLVTCCSCSKNARFLAEVNPSNVPKVVVHDVVRIPQNDNYSCATTSLAMAITFYEGRKGNPIDKDTAWAISGSDIQTIRTQGNDMYGLERLANHYGYFGEFMSNLTIPQVKTTTRGGGLTDVNRSKRLANLAPPEGGVTAQRSRVGRGVGRPPLVSGCTVGSWPHPAQP